jgi:alkylhydroperoxidase family enzyme
MISIRFDDGAAELPARTVRLLRLRASRVRLVPPCLNAAERAALALTDAASELCDRTGGVPEEVWREAARHYDEAALAALVIEIARSLDDAAPGPVGIAA